MIQSSSSASSETTLTAQAQPPASGNNSATPNSGAFYPGGQAAGPRRTNFVLLLIGAFLFVFVAGISIGALEWWVLAQNKKDQATADQPKQAQPVKQWDTTADSASQALNQRVAHDSPGERQPLAEALALAEDTYPTDYRFPFEHAKVTVTGNAHHHAFGLLFLAGQRAIDAGKADQLLADLEKEKDGAFHRCSKGHDEWKMLENALKNRDKSMLEKAMANMHRDIIGGADDMVMNY